MISQNPGLVRIVFGWSCWLVFVLILAFLPRMSHRLFVMDECGWTLWRQIIQALLLYTGTTPVWKRLICCYSDVYVVKLIIVLNIWSRDPHKQISIVPRSNSMTCCSLSGIMWLFCDCDPTSYVSPFLLWINHFSDSTQLAGLLLIWTQRYLLTVTYCSFLALPEM